MTSAERDYLNVVYNECDRPLTGYPQLLVRHLFDRFGFAPNDRVLEIGCGRGEFLQGFVACGARAYGVDRSPTAGEHSPDAIVTTCDL